jgi:hypothetical protein
MSRSLVVGNRSSLVVFGEFWAGTVKIDIDEKVKAKRKIRERMVVKNETRKLVAAWPKARSNSVAAN